MQQLLTGKKRLNGFTQHWEEVKLGEVLEESNIPSNKTDKERRITVKLHLGGVEKREVRGTEADSTNFYVRKKGQLVYGKQNFHNGAIGIIPENLDNYESTSDIPSFDILPNINKTFLFYYITRTSFYKRMELKTTGTGSKRLHPRELFSTSILYPSLEEQTAIAAILSAADKEIRLLEQKLASLKTQKKGLMQQLLTGKKRLV
ncbi:restriction endonuclease subunit S [Ornithobacterium rhinotracheale]|nr:restriction endonuclease subunit S [Ornithobacterium rhinotracheale]